MIGALGRGLRGAGRFLWSFFVDDTPEVPLIVAVVVAAAYALRTHDAVAVVVVPVVAVAGLVFCVWRACRPSAARNAPAPGPQRAPTGAPGPTPPLQG